MIFQLKKTVRVISPTYSKETFWLTHPITNETFGVDPYGVNGISLSVNEVLRQLFRRMEAAATETAAAFEIDDTIAADVMRIRESRRKVGSCRPAGMNKW